MSETIVICVNDDEVTVPGGTLLKEIPEQFGLNPDTVVMLVNGEPAPRETWGERVLADGDRIDLARFVGGG